MLFTSGPMPAQWFLHFLSTFRTIKYG